MTSENTTGGLPAHAGVALSEEAAARLAQQAQGLKASLAKLRALDLHAVDPAFIFALTEDEDA